MNFIQFLLILAFANLIYSGVIYPDTSRPIDPFRNNVPRAGATVDSDYTFHFRVQTPSSNYPIIRVKFPTIFMFTVGATYTCTFKQSSTTITEECIVEAGNILKFPSLAKGSTSFSEIIGASSSLTVVGLKNPTVAAGTGTSMFAFYTYSQENVLFDSNEDFGTIGLSAPYSNFTKVSISNDGAPIAGFVTNYILQFQNTIITPIGSWFRLKFPDGYGFGSTLCSFLGPVMDIQCFNDGNYLKLVGLSHVLSPGTYRIRLRNIRNPYNKGDQSGFLFESLREGTNTVIEQSSNIGNITITAGAINSPSITGLPLNRNSYIDYTISFTPSNTIPERGCIKIVFPNTFGSLDSTCRIIRGLTGTSTGLKCTADSSTKSISISGFTVTPPQYIELKIYATNPNNAGLTPQFQISTYRACPATNSTLIDENLNAGQVTISDVENPVFLAIDIYQALVNTSLNVVNPLDFRLYPKNALPATASGAYGRIWLQIPLWWFGVYSIYVYRCNFGTIDSGDTGGCTYSNQVFKMYTPKTQGFSLCDLPISIENVRVTPIPGKWDFRVLTFINSSIPVEQDLWTMDIPADPLSTVTGLSTSLDTNDNDAVVRVTFRTIVTMPVEGAINFNMSTQQDIYANTAAWDPTLGFNTFGNQSFTQISCRIVIGSYVVGYSNAPYHKKANCVLYKGNDTQNAIIQIRGFSQSIGSNTYVAIDIPNVKICGDIGMKCVFQLSTAYTTALTDPYTLNYYTVNLGTIQGPNSPILSTVGAQPTFTPTMICQDATYQFVITPKVALSKSDNILIKFPASKFTFRRDNITSSFGTVAVIYVSETDEIFFLVQLTANLGTTAQTLYLYNVRNSNGENQSTPRDDDFTGIDISAIYWSTYKEIEHITFAKTANYTDGGIYGTAIDYYPNVANDASVTFTRILNLNDMIPQSLTFYVCHKVNSDGGIKIFVPMSDYLATSPTCQARSGLVGQSDNNGFTNQMNCVFNNGGFEITGFTEVAQFTKIIIGFSLKTLTAGLQPGGFNISTFYNANMTAMNDFLNGTITALSTIGATKMFPTTMEVIDWLAPTKIARVGTLGTFDLLVSLTQGLPAYSSVNDAHILFKLDASMGLQNDSMLDCRHNGLISYHCEPVGSFEIKMPTNQFTGITAGTSTEIVLTTLGAYKSSNYEDGIMFTKAGRFTLTAEAYNGGVMTESSQLEFEIVGKDFLKYWVFGFNKAKGGINLLRIYVTLNDLDIFPSSDKVDGKGKIVLEFERSTGTGYASDLGTGIADKGSIPCNSVNLPILNTTSDIQCTLLYGLFNNPTQIEITGFNETNATITPSFEIHIPRIYNPDNSGLSMEVPQVITRIYEVNTTTGDENELFYHSYDLINVTYPQNPAVGTKTISTPPTMNETTLNSNSTLTIKIVPTYQLSKSDKIVLQLPLFWKPPKIVKCNVGGNTQCIGYPDANWIAVDITTAAIPTSGVTATFDIVNPPALLPSTASIIGYYFHESKLWTNVTYAAVGTTFIPYVITQANVTSPDGNYSTRSTFMISFITPEAIPDGGAIRIVIPSSYTIGDTSCENDALSGSALSDTGFQCSINSTTKELVAYGFPALAKNNLIVLKARLDTPATNIAISNFTIQTHYIYANPLSTLIAQGTTAAPPIVSVSASTEQFWDNQYLQRDYLYAGDIGPVDFLLNLPSSFSTSDTLVVDIPTGFGLSPEGQPYCLWNNVRAVNCNWDSTVTPNQLKITSPTSQSFSASQNITLRLTSLNGDNGKNGLALPTISGSYEFSFRTSSDGGTTTREKQKITVQVYAKKFQLFYSTTEIINYNMKTSIKIEFQPETPIPVGGRLVLSIPTRDNNGVFLFNDDLRSGLNNGDNIPCHDVESSFGFEPTCVLTYGNRQLGLPAKVEVTGWTSPLLVTKEYKFRLNKVINPPESGDNKHVVMRLESFSDLTAASVINAGLHYDFTIQKYDPAIVTAPYTPTTSPMNAAQSGVSFTVRLYSTETSRAAAKFDYFVIEFPPLIPQPLGLKCIDVTNTDCISLPGNNWVIYDKTDADFPATTYVATSIINAQQVMGVIPSSASILTSYSVRDRIAITQVTYPYIDYSTLSLQPPITATLTVPSITSTQIPYSAPIMFFMTFTAPSGSLNLNVPASGAVEITLPAGVTAVDPYCVNDDTSQITGDYQCSLSGQIYTITNFNQINAGTTGAIIFWAQVTTANPSPPPIFKLAFYQDAEKQMKIAENTNVASPAISTYSGFQKLYAVDTDPLNNFAARAGDVVPFKFYITPGSSYVDPVTVTFPAGVSVPTGATLTCGFGIYEAKSCTVSTTSPLTITIESPHTPALSAGSTYQAFITTFGSTSTNKKGLMFPDAGKLQVEVTVGIDTVKIPIEIYSIDFTSLILRPFWSNVGVTNNLAVELQPATEIPTGGKIVIEFPQFAYDGSTLFAADLGTGQVSNTQIFCTSETKSTFVPVGDEIICTLYYITGTFTRVEITGFNTVSTSSAIELFIAGFKNPSTPDTAHVFLQVYTEDTSGNVLDKRLVEDVFTPQNVTSTSLSTTYTRSKNNVQDPGVTYTLSSLTAITGKTINTRSTIVLKFPDIFTIPKTITVSVTGGNTAVSTSFKTYANYIVITPLGTFPTGVVSITLSGVTNPMSKDDTTGAAGGIRAYFVYARSYEAEIVNTANPAVDFAVGTITFANFQYTAQFTMIDHDYMIQLSLDNKIPAGGAIKLTFTSFQALKECAVISGLKTPVTYTTTTNSGNQIVLFTLGKSYTPSDGDIVIKISATPPTATGTFNIVAEALYSAANSLRVISNATQAYAITTSATAATATILNSYIQASQATNIQLSYVISTTTAPDNTTEVRVVLGNFVDIGANDCMVNGAAPTEICQVSGNVLIMRGFNLNASPTPNIITFTLQSPSDSGITRLYVSTATVTRDSTYNGAGMSPELSETYIDTGSAYARVFPSQFASFSLNVVHTSTSYPNVLDISFQIGGTDILYPVFYVELPGFPTSLGSYTNGATIPCQSFTHPTLKCTLELANNYRPVRVRVDGLTSLTASSTVSLQIFRINSPSTESTVNILFKVASIAMGNYENDIYAQATPVTFVSGTPSISSVALGLTDNSVRSVTSYTLSMSSVSLDVGDMVIYHLPYTDYAFTPSIPSCAQTCTLYPKAGVLITEISSSVSTFDNIVSNLNNPPGTPTSTSNVIGYVVQNNIITNVVTFTQSSFARASFTSVTLKSLQLNGVTAASAYSLAFTVGCDIPAGGIIRLTFLLSDFTASPTATALKMIQGTYTGTLNFNTTVSSPNVYIDITDFTSFSPGPVLIYFNLNQGKTSGTVTGSVNSYMDSTGSSGIETASISFTYNSSTQKFYSFRGTRFLMGATNTLKIGNGIFAFTFKQSSATGPLAVSSRKLRVTPPSTFPFSSSLPIRCKFTNMVTGVSYLSQDCSKNSLNQYEIQPPTSNQLSVDEWRVSIFTVGSNIRGLPFASTNVKHVFTINIEVDSTSVIVETNIIRYRVFNGIANRGFVTSYLNNINESNMLKFQTMLANPLSVANGKILIEFPIINPLGTLNSNSLYTGLAFRSQFACNPKKNGVSFSAKCRLVPGAAYDQKPTLIIIEEFASALATNDQIEVTIPIKNGPTLSLWTTARIVTVDSGSQLDLFTFEYVTYTSSPSSSSVTRTFPSGFSSLEVQSSTDFTLNVNPSSPVSLTATNSRLRFTYNNDYYGTSQAVTGHTMELWTTNTAFITFNTDPGTTPVNFAMTSFVNPMSVASFSSSFQATVIKKKVIVATILYTQSPLPILTSGTFISATVTKDSDLKNQIAQYTATFTLDKDIPAGGIIKFVFPSGFTLQANTCTLWNVAFTTCSFSGLVLTFTGINSVNAGTTLNIIVSAKNPSVSGTTGTFGLYSYDSGNNAIATLTGIPGTSINTLPSFNILYVYDFLTNPKKAQAKDTAPMVFTITLQSNLNRVSDYVSITFPSASPEYMLANTTTLMTDLVCKWNNLVASKCQRITNGYRIYTPVETDLSLGSAYTISIAHNRYVPSGFIYPARGSYSVSVIDSYSQSVSKTFSVLNDGFKSAFTLSRITTMNQYTLLYMKLTTKNDVQPQSVDNRGQLIVEFATLVENNIDAFPVDLGKGVNNGDQVDCVSNMQFTCKLSKGGKSLTAPTSIILDPQAFTNNGTEIEVRLALIQLPPGLKTYTPLRIYFRQYDFSSSTWTILEEFLSDIIFYTMQSTIDTTQVNLAAPVFNPNQVGAPTTVTFSFNLQSTVGTLEPYTYDRLVLYTNTTYIRIQKEGVTSTQANVTTHQIAQWFEMSPTTNLAPSPSFSINFANWTNVPYVISGGVKWEVYVWKDGNIKQKITYAYTAAASPHDFQPTPSVIGYNSKIRAVTTYQITFLPYNQIPAGGTIEVGIPKEYLSLNPQCDIQSLVGASCTVQDGDDSKKFVLTGFQSYDPATDGVIKLEVTMVNPKVGGSIGPFTLTTMYPGGHLIDQNLSVYYMTIDASATFLEFELESLLQLQTKTCGGNPGPLKIRFQLMNTLSFPNDYLTITLDKAFSKPPNYDELLCYFKYSDIYNLKTHRCDWSSNVITVYAPEEKNFVAGTEIELTITTRGANVKYQDGVSVPKTPGQYYVRIDTSNSKEEGYPIVQIPACPFKNFTAESIVWHQGSSSLLNFTLINTATIPAAQLGGRIVVEIPTNNEIGPTFLPDLGRSMPSDLNAAPIGCGGLCVGCPTGTYPTGDQTAYTECTLMRAAGQDFGDRAIIFTTDFQAIPESTYFNFQVARIVNPTGTGWPYWTHVRIRTQAKSSDGSYTDLNDHWAYFIVPNFLPAVTVTPTVGPAPTMWTTWVNHYGNYSLKNVPPVLLEPYDFVIYEFLPSDFVLLNTISCDQNYNISMFTLVKCVPYNDSNWIAVLVGANYTSFNLVIYNNMKQPYYQVSVQIKAYYIKNHLITGITQYTPYTTYPPGLEVALQTPSNTNDVGLTLKYQIGIFPYSQSSKVQYMRLLMPPQFKNPRDCVIRRGLILKDVNNPYAPIQCVITPQGTGGSGGYLIEIYDFDMGADWWCIIDMVLTNPSTPGFTGTWNNTSYDNYNGTYTNFSRIMDKNETSDGRTWIGVKPFPNLFRVFRNTLSFEERRATENEYGELHMRLITKKPIPPSTGKIEIWLPDSFDIPNGGDAVCQIGNDYHTDLTASSCKIASNRRIDINANSLVGINNGTCSLIMVTSQNSANGNNGFQTASDPGNYEFQVFIYNGATLQEFSSPQSNVSPDPFTTVNVKVIDRQMDFISVVRVTFTTPRTIPAGYDTDTTELDVFLKNPIGAIFVDFNTKDIIGGYEGWPLNLGFTSTTDVPCKIISGMSPKNGDNNIKCTLIPSTSANTKFPARVVITNFETILGDTSVEFHLLNLKTIIDISNNGWIQVGAYETSGDNSTTQIISPTLVNQLPLYGIGVVPQIWTYTDLGGSAFLSPHTVGSVLIMNLPYNTTTALAAGDLYKVIFPSPQFEIPDDGSISAVIDGIQLIPYIYNDSRINEIHFQIPDGYSMVPNNTVPDKKILSISQFRDMAYADSSNFTIQIWVTKNDRRQELIQYVNLPPAAVSNFNSLSLVLSSLFSGEVYVIYDFTIVPSYHIPAGSQFRIFLPSPLYDYIFKSDPAAICTIISTDLITNCIGTTTVGVSNIINFVAKTRITGSTRLSLRLTGVKNPTFIGTLPAGSINMQVLHTNGKLINTGNFTKITFASPKTPDKISLDIAVSSIFKSVDADYMFSLQNSNQLPIGGKIILAFPSDWKSILPAGFNAISQMKASFSNQALFYTIAYNATTGRLEITTQFIWPAKTSLYIQINGLANPSNIDMTGIFRALTIYDSVTLDQTDPLDTSARITFETPPPPINVLSTSVAPSNEGEAADYTLKLSPGSDIPAGSQLEMIFPTSYGPLLTTVDIEIQCSSLIMPNLVCEVNNGKLIITINTNITSGTPFDLKITGITNPISGTANNINLLITNGNTTLQFMSKATTVTSTVAPTAFSLTQLITSSTNLQTQSKYTICAETDQPIPANAKVFIEFPQQFIIQQSVYDCAVTPDNTALTYPTGVTCTVEKNLRRFILTGQSNFLAGGTMKSLCYSIDGIENPADSGESNSFAMKIYDPATTMILYRSYGTLSYPTTIVYKRVGLRVIVGQIADFPVGLESDYVSVKLERSVPYEVQLAPSTMGFSFDPTIIYFRPDLDAVQKFRVKPNTGTAVGTYFIEWAKFENSTDTRFAAVPNTYFKYLASGAYGEYRVTLGTTISRTALRATSLPISVTLNQSPAKNMTIYINTLKPKQPEYVDFNPPYLVFQPGELEKTFQYTVHDGAVSGVIQFTLQSDYKNVYYMPTDSLSFEILDIDNEPPQILNEYIVTLDRTYMYYRISTSESVWVNYMLTLKGTRSPPSEEILNPQLRVERQTKTDVIETTGTNSSYQTSITKTYIYYDIYIMLTGLEEQTDYYFFYVTQDLSGNYLSTRKVEFTTMKKHQPAIFSILLTQDTNEETLKAAFSLVTGMTTTRWDIIAAPKKFDLLENSDPMIKEILDQGTVTYNIMLLQDPYSDEKSPINTISLLESNKYLLEDEITDLVTDYDINKYSYEVIEFDQEISYKPILIDVTEDSATFNISIKRNGTLYGVVVLKGSERPNARQIKYGLNASNFLVDDGFYAEAQFVYPLTLPFGVRKRQKMNFSGLYENTEYEVHFVAENTLPVNPDLMEDDEIVTVSFVTQRAMFLIPSDYRYEGYVSLIIPNITLTIIIISLMLLL